MRTRFRQTVSYKIIWFFELDPSSLWGKTMALSTTTSPGMETLLPERRQSSSSSDRCVRLLPITVIDGWSLPSWNNESCSILENCLFGSGSSVMFAISLRFSHFVLLTIRRAFHSTPRSDRWVPGNNRIQYATMILERTNEQMFWLIRVLLEEHNCPRRSILVHEHHNQQLHLDQWKHSVLTIEFKGTSASLVIVEQQRCSYHSCRSNTGSGMNEYVTDLDGEKRAKWCLPEVNLSLQ